MSTEIIYDPSYYELSQIAYFLAYTWYLYVILLVIAIVGEWKLFEAPRLHSRDFSHELDRE